MTGIAIDRLLGIAGDNAIKAPCRVAAAANVPLLNGLLSIDGVTLAQSDRVLLTAQTDPTQNGIYAADTGDWNRDLDFDGVGDFVQGTIVVVVAGTVYGSTVWELTTAAPVIGGALTFSLMGASALMLASPWIRANLLPALTAALARAALGALGFADSGTFSGNYLFSGTTGFEGVNSFTGATSVPNQSLGNNTALAANTAFVAAALAAFAPAGGTGKRQTVQNGPRNSNGSANLLPSTSVNLNLSTQNLTVTPAVANAANGFGTGAATDRIGASAVDLVWTGLTASSTNYLYWLVSSAGVLTPAFTVLPPVIQAAGTPSTTAGQITINTEEKKAYLGSGSAAVQTWLVLVGEAVTSGSAVTGTVAYAYSGEFDSGWTNTLPTVSTALAVSHNLGVQPRAVDLIIECITTDAGYAVGDQLRSNNFTGNAATNDQIRPVIATTRNALSFIITGSYNVAHKTTAADTGVTAANWKYKFVARAD